MSGPLDQDVRFRLQTVDSLLPQGPIQHARLTETAAADTSPHDFECHTVLRRLDIGDHGFCRIRCIGQIHACLLSDLFRNALRIRKEASDRTVLIIFHIIKCGDIAARDSTGRSQEFMLSGTLVFHFHIEIHERIEHGLAVAYVEKIKEIRQRFRIVGTWPSADDDRKFIAAVLRVIRDLRKIQYLQDIGIAELILQRESEEIESFDRFLRLERKERNLLLLHDRMQIRPGRVGALTPDIRSSVQLIIDDLDPEMGHSDLIDIRKAHAEAHGSLFRSFDDGINFISDIAGRLLDRAQDPVAQKRFSHSSRKGPRIRNENDTLQIRSPNRFCPAVRSSVPMRQPPPPPYNLYYQAAAKLCTSWKLYEHFHFAQSFARACSL